MAYHRFRAALYGAIAAVSVAVAAPAQAGIVLGGSDTGMLQLGVGGFDVFHDYTAGIFRGEYRLGTPLWLLTPLVGGEVTTDGGLYGYGGFALDIHFDDHWILSPNEAVGLWTRGDGKNLGSFVEFRSGAELDYRFDDNQRLGVSFHHISNAGLTKHNPGEEEALFLWSMPFGSP